MREYRAHSAASGFTLIELLLGAVITAVVLAALYEIFYGFLQAQSRAYAHLEEAAPRAQVIAIMKSDLENMTVPNGILCGTVTGESLGDGDSHSDALEFCTASGKLGETMPWGDVQKVQYFLDDPETEQGTGSKTHLMRAAARNLLAQDIEGEGEATTLLDKVASLEFQYFDGQVWSESWDSTAVDNALPRAVRVRIAFLPRDTGGPPAQVPIEIVCETVARSAGTAAGPTGGSKSPPKGNNAPVS